MLQTSEQTLSVWTKIFKIQEKGLSVVKATPNAAYKQNGKVSKYADLNSILDVLIPELNEVKLVTGFMLTGDGLILQVTDIETGEWIRFACALNLTGQTAQQIGSQITYYRRYMFNSLFNLQAEDDDGNATSSVKVVPEVEAPKAIPATAVKPGFIPEGNKSSDSNSPSLKPELKGGTPAAEQLKKAYAEGKLTKWSQITDVYVVSEQTKIAMKAVMPNIDFNS